MKKKSKTCFRVPWDPRDERKTSPDFVFGRIFFLDQFFLHNSLLEPIIDGFEPIETWGIDGGMRGFNYLVKWPYRMPVYA